MEPNQVGIALVSVGGILLAISIALIIIGHYRTLKKTVSRSLEYFDARTSADTISGMRLSVMPLRLKYDTTINGKIILVNGAFEFFLYDFFGWIPRRGLGQWVHLPYVHMTVTSPGSEQKFEAFVEPGDYCLFFRTNSQTATANIELNMTHHIKSLKQLVEVGLAILQVAIPVLITGFIIYVGLSPA